MLYEDYAKIVRKYVITAADGMGSVVLTGTVIHLLRLQRRAMAREVRKLQKRNARGVLLKFAGTPIAGYYTACNDILLAFRKSRT